MHSTRLHDEAAAAADGDVINECNSNIMRLYNWVGTQADLPTLLFGRAR
jgi:hypothetical protein